MTISNMCINNNLEYDKESFCKLLLTSIVISLNYSAIFSLYITENIFFTIVMITFNTLFCFHSIIKFDNVKENYKSCET